MDAEKKKRLAKKGWVSISVQDFLGLTPNEMTYIEQEKYMKVNLISPSKEKSAPSA